MLKVTPSHCCYKTEIGVTSSRQPLNLDQLSREFANNPNKCELVSLLERLYLPPIYIDQYVKFRNEGICYKEIFATKEFVLGVVSLIPGQSTTEYSYYGSVAAVKLIRGIICSKLYSINPAKDISKRKKHDKPLELGEVVGIGIDESHEFLCIAELSVAIILICP